jgi:hypothetical protein
MRLSKTFLSYSIFLQNYDSCVRKLECLIFGLITVNETQIVIQQTALVYISLSLH